jgi:hypothetical protein
MFAHAHFHFRNGVETPEPIRSSSRLIARACSTAPRPDCQFPTSNIGTSPPHHHSRLYASRAHQQETKPTRHCQSPLTNAARATRWDRLHDGPHSLSHGYPCSKSCGHPRHATYVVWEVHHTGAESWRTIAVKVLPGLGHRPRRDRVQAAQRFVVAARISASMPLPVFRV